MIRKQEGKTMKALQIRDFGTVKNEEMGRLFIMENEAGTKAVSYTHLRAHET